MTGMVKPQETWSGLRAWWKVRRIRRGLCILALAAALAGCPAEDSPLQSDLRLADFDIVDTVKMGGTDLKSGRFQKDWLGDLILQASGSFNSTAIKERFADVMLDPARLEITEATSVRVHFVGEASGYACGLGFRTSGPNGIATPPQFIFPSKEAEVQLYDYGGRIDKETKRLDLTKRGKRSKKTPLLPGDFVDLGRLTAGTRLDFFLVAKDSGGKTNTYWSRLEDNADGVPHVVAIAVPDSPYLLLGFEDMFGGGDKDFSDCVFAVETSAYNIQALMGRIDPLRRAKQLAVVGTLVLVFVGGPIAFFAGKRHLRMRRLKQVEKDAQELLDAADPDKALALVRGAKKVAGGKTEREALTGLELSALERLDRAVDMHRLYDDSPQVFTEREAASLRVGRVQLEQEEFDAYADLRGSWRKREQSTGMWATLDADALQLRGRSDDTRTLLESYELPGAQDARRLARLGRLEAAENPDEARQLLGRAVKLAPADPDVHLRVAEAAEALGDAASAAKAYGAALAHAPSDPITRDHVAEFYRRKGEHPEALSVWRAGLEPPTSDTIWLKALFWSRVASPVSVASAGAEALEGENRVLIDFLRVLPPERFWDAQRFAEVAKQFPHLESRQDVFWLRLLDALAASREAEALSLLNLQRFGQHSWHEDLEITLIRLVTFRRLGFMEPGLVKAGAPTSHEEAQHPFFQVLEQWTAGKLEAVPEDLQTLLRSGEAYPAAFLAAGWSEAGLRLRRAEGVDPALPDWFARDVDRALRRRAADG